jgi:hypothetical protein
MMSQKADKPHAASIDGLGTLLKLTRKRTSNKRPKGFLASTPHDAYPTIRGPLLDH